MSYLGKYLKNLIRVSNIEYDRDLDKVFRDKYPNRKAHGVYIRWENVMEEDKTEAEVHSGKLYSDQLPTYSLYSSGIITRIEYYDNGVLHREDGPAYSKRDSGGITYKYYRHGKLHREDGPAYITPSANVWYRDGCISREDGPAIIVHGLITLPNEIITDYEKIHDVWVFSVTIDPKLDKLLEQRYSTKIHELLISKKLPQSDIEIQYVARPHRDSGALISLAYVQNGICKRIGLPAIEYIVDKKVVVDIYSDIYPIYRYKLLSEDMSKRYPLGVSVSTDNL